MTRFRPCIDVRDGRVTQIVGSTLSCDSTSTTTNWTATDSSSAADFARLYADDSLSGGHIIALGGGQASQDAIIDALNAFPGGLQVGGGINPINARQFLEAGASHVIITSYVFVDGALDRRRLSEIVDCVGRDRLVLDLSCRRRRDHLDGPYYVVTDRWQRYSDYVVDRDTLLELGEYCGEFLVHGVDVEGKRQGIEDDLVSMLSDANVPVTYAGGVRSLADMDRVLQLGKGRVDVSVGSALDIFGGDLKYKDVVEWSRQHSRQQT